MGPSSSTSFVSLLASVLLLVSGCATVGDQAAMNKPMLSVIELFKASTVPVRGPSESEFITRTWPESTKAVARPGKGLAQHPMVYAGEGYNTLFVVSEGKVSGPTPPGPGARLTTSG